MPNTFYLDFVIDGSASMYTVFPAVYYAITHFLDAFSKYNIYPQMGITLFRSEKNGERTEYVTFDKGEFFTGSDVSFLKKLRGVSLYGGGTDGKESVHTAIQKSLEKFSVSGRNRSIMLFTDAYASNDYADYHKLPLGQAVLFTTEELSEEDFRFCLIQEDGEVDEEASPMFLDLSILLKPLSSQVIEDVVKPLTDLMKGVSIGG